MLRQPTENDYRKRKFSPLNSPKSFPVNSGKFCETFLRQSGSNTLRSDFSSDCSK
jgi:hypothetical protein